jgi:hypothetical protein
MPSSSGGAYSHLIDDDRTPIAALRHELRVTQALHQHDPCTRDSGNIP